MATNTLHAIAKRRFLVHGDDADSYAAYWVEVGEPVEVHQTRTGRWRIHSRRHLARTVTAFTFDQIEDRVACE